MVKRLILILGFLALAILCGALMNTGVFPVEAQQPDPGIAGATALPQHTATVTCDLPDRNDTSSLRRTRLAFMGTGSGYYYLRTLRGQYIYVPVSRCILFNPTWR